MSTFDRIIKVFNMVVPEVDCSNVTLETMIREELGMNSLKMIQMAVMLEDEFGIKLKYKENLNTVSNVVEWIESSIDQHE